MTRNLPFATTFNFRDLGGYPGLDGRAVRWRRLFRSDSLHRLDEADQQAFLALGVRTVVDLRRETEVSRDGRVPHHPGLDYRHLPPEHRNWDEVAWDESMVLERWLADRYLDLAEEGAGGLAAVLGLLADAEQTPVVVHCVAGKDRTGVVCALTLAVLGVSDEIIAEDYALSGEAAERFKAWVSSQTTEPLVYRPYYSCPAKAMALFLSDLRLRYGSVEAYLENAGLGRADLAALRAHLLE